MNSIELECGGVLVKPDSRGRVCLMAAGIDPESMYEAHQEEDGSLTLRKVVVRVVAENDFSDRVKEIIRKGVEDLAQGRSGKAADHLWKGLGDDEGES